jgi:hypothetical protein
MAVKEIEIGRESGRGGGDDGGDEAELGCVCDLVSLI